VISDLVDMPQSICTADLDGDGDGDVLSASADDDMIAWYENLGYGAFGPRQVITLQADYANSVYTTDLDEDGDADVLSASSGDHKIAWYENLGGGAFGPQQIIVIHPYGTGSVQAADLDSDGDADVLSVFGATNGGSIAWSENLGGGSFGPSQEIASLGTRPGMFRIGDLDGDGDADVLYTAGKHTGEIGWVETLGGGHFGPRQVIATLPTDSHRVCPVDLDGDGDADVLAGAFFGDWIAWYENLGGGVFGPQQIIADPAYSISSVYAADLDTDGDIDVLSTTAYVTGKVCWFENLGGGSFGPQQVITDQCHYPTSIHATDLDGDGDADVLCAMLFGDKIEWYENLMVPPWTQSPINGHWYRLLPPLDWHVAENTYARGWGGHLCTIRSLVENDWLQAAFLTSRPTWIGYTDEFQEGVFEWSSGETPGFENWGSGQPDDASGADWAVIVPGSGAWRDEPNLVPHPGVVEVISDDCDANNVPDVYELAVGARTDWNGDGVLDVCLSANFCTAADNSTGAPAIIGVYGSPIVASNTFTLAAWHLPLHEYAYFLMSDSADFVPGFGGSSGNLCLGIPIARLNDPNTGGALLHSGFTGKVDLTLDFNNLPHGLALQPGDTWYFQLWFRDFTTYPTSNTTDGIQVRFR